MIEVRCTECAWAGEFGDLLSDVQEDSDGDLVGEHINACPECHAATEDVHLDDDDDLSDGYAS